MKPSKSLLTALLFCQLLLPGMRSIAQVVQPDTAAVDTTGGFGMVKAWGTISKIAKLAVMHAYGLVNVAFGAKIEFDWENLSVNYIGGLADKFYDPNLPDNPSGLSPYVVTGNSQLHIPATWASDTIYPHELHHLWQSRAMGNKFLLHYALQGINSLLRKTSFKSDGNYYEDFIENNKWW